MRALFYGVAAAVILYLGYSIVSYDDGQPEGEQIMVAVPTQEEAGVSVHDGEEPELLEPDEGHIPPGEPEYTELELAAIQTAEEVAALYGSFPSVPLDSQASAEMLLAQIAPRASPELLERTRSEWSGGRISYFYSGVTVPEGSYFVQAEGESPKLYVAVRRTRQYQDGRSETSDIIYYVQLQAAGTGWIATDIHS